MLFTDLVGSTELASSLSPEAADELRRKHFSALRRAIAASGGTEVKNLGDGLMVVFPVASAALGCAVAMQQTVHRENHRGDRPLGLRVGLSAGEATRESDDYFGDPVVEAARLCAKADSGQILITDLVRANAGRRSTHSFTSLGELELKGLPVPIETLEVHWEPRVDEPNVGEVPLPARLLSTVGRSFGFSGRDPELGLLVQAQKTSATEATLQVVLVAGEPGIGKTSLASEVARRSHRDGVTVLLGTCQEDIGAPYQPWNMALTHLVRHCPGEVLDRIGAVHAGTLRRFLPNDSSRLPLGDSVTSDPETEQHLLMDAMTRLFEVVSESNAIFLIVDDLHWADAASLAMLRHMIGSSVPLRMTIVATYRHSDLSPKDPLTALLADLHRETCVVRLNMSGLDDVEMIDLVKVAVGDQTDDEATALAQVLRQETGGNPFFVGEILRHLAETGAFGQDQEGRISLGGAVNDLALPPSVRDVVTRRVRRLGDEALRVLSIAAVVGQDFSLEVLEPVAEVGPDRLLDLLEAAATAALVMEARDHPGRYRFTHALIQHTLYEELSAARLQRLHLRVAEILESLAGVQDEAAHTAELARHWLAATTPTNTAKAIEYSRRAGDAARESLAMLDAARWYQQALELAERDAGANHELRCRLLISLGLARMISDPEAGRLTMMEAGRLAEEIGVPELLVTWATTRLSGWRASEAADPEVLRLTRKALESVGEGRSDLKARLLGALTEETDPGSWRERRDLAVAARAEAEASGNDAVFLEVFIATDFVTSADQAAERVKMAARAAEIAERGSDPLVLSGALINYSDSLLTMGEIDEARNVIDRNQTLAAAFALPTLRHLAAMEGVVVNMISGDLAALEFQAETLLTLSAEVPQSLATYGGSLFELRWAQGRLGEFAAMFSDAITELRSYAGFRPALVMAYLETDQSDDARAVFADDAANRFESFPRDSIWLACMSLYAEAAIRLSDSEAALAIYDLLAPYCALHCCGGPIYYGSVDRSLGTLAAFLGRAEEAEGRLRNALSIHRDIGARYWTARTALDLGDLLLRQEAARSDEEARLLLRDCEDLAKVHGYGGVGRLAASLRREFGA